MVVIGKRSRNNKPDLQFIESSDFEAIRKSELEKTDAIHDIVLDDGRAIIYRSISDEDEGIVFIADLSKHESDKFYRCKSIWDTKQQLRRELTDNGVYLNERPEIGRSEEDEFFAAITGSNEPSDESKAYIVDTLESKGMDIARFLEFRTSLAFKLIDRSDISINIEYIQAYIKDMTTCNYEEYDEFMITDVIMELEK